MNNYFFRIEEKKGLGISQLSGAYKRFLTASLENKPQFYCDSCVITFQPSRSQTLPNNERSEWSVLMNHL